MALKKRSSLRKLNIHLDQITTGLSGSRRWTIYLKHLNILSKILIP